jgi:nitric-oxide synthase, bacterial
MRTLAGHLGLAPAAAEEFLRLHHPENPDAGPVQPRLDAVLAQIDRHGSYPPTAAELAFGARVAWRNSAPPAGPPAASAPGE